jgi:hypothetical protein
MEGLRLDVNACINKRIFNDLEKQQPWLTTKASAQVDAHIYNRLMDIVEELRVAVGLYEDSYYDIVEERTEV